jgi:hypothetical membrane protein
VRRPTDEKAMSARILALGGIAGVVVFAVVVVVCSALRPGYSHVTQFISELGENGGSRSWLMNFAGFIPTGLLFAAFGVSLSHLMPRTATSLVASLLIVVYGLGIVGAGVYACDPGCPNHHLSTEATLHRVVSITAFIAAILGIALWAYCFRARADWRALWRFSAITSALALVLLLLMGAAQDTRTLVGVWQRLFIATLDAWCAIVGYRAYRALARAG